MAITLFILLLIWLLYRVFRKGKPASPNVPSEKPVTTDDSVKMDRPAVKPGWVIQRHTRHFERKTYIRGILLAKFHGELDYLKDLDQFVRERFFDFQLYDARIEQAEFRKNNEGPFSESEEGDVYPGPVEPNPLPCSVSYLGISGEFTILLQNARLSHIDFNKYRKLHMEEDDLVFGTIEARITGHILEQFTEEHEVQLSVVEEAARVAGPVFAENRRTANSSVSAREHTGKTKIEGGYRWKEFRAIGGGTAVWGSPSYVKSDGFGCGGVIGFIFLGWLLIVFLSAIGAHGVILLLLLVAVSLLISFFSGLFRPLLWLLVVAMLVAGVASLTSRVAYGPDRQSVVFAHDQPDETERLVRERSGSGGEPDSEKWDSVILHHRVWKDDGGSVYEGDIWVRASDMTESRAFKDRLTVSREPLVGYDQMLNALQTNDSSRLPGAYSLLDSIRMRHPMDAVRFADVVVCFVQDIPYSLILDGDCNPDLYADPFTRNYLHAAGASCSGYQRFGINTPVEFLGTMKGDCDTRTLLLFTLLNHYGYDVAILSSEVYGHSLLGVVLPLPGVVYPYRGKSYLLWETTTPGMPPGVIALSVNNLFNWRISITSKYAL